MFSCVGNESQNIESTKTISKKILSDMLSNKGTNENPTWIYKGVPFNGIGLSYFENGQLQHEINLKDGINDGSSTGWYENGQIESTGNYKDGKEDGIHKYYESDGTLSSKTNYKNGLKNGLWKSYDNGRLLWEENYKDGIKDGLSRIYSPFSDMETEEMWKEEELIETKYWKDGKLLDL